LRPSDPTHRLEEATVSASTRLTRRSAAALATLLIALAVLPALASARPYYDGPGYQLSGKSEPAATVVRTVIKEEESLRVLPIALAGAALVVALAGAGYIVARVAPLQRQLRIQA
jgi:hypothetical protein